MCIVSWCEEEEWWKQFNTISTGINMYIVGWWECQEDDGNYRVRCDGPSSTDGDVMRKRSTSDRRGDQKGVELKLFLWSHKRNYLGNHTWSSEQNGMVMAVHLYVIGWIISSGGATVHINGVVIIQSYGCGWDCLRCPRLDPIFGNIWPNSHHYDTYKHFWIFSTIVEH